MTNQRDENTNNSHSTEDRNEKMTNENEKNDKSVTDDLTA